MENYETLNDEKLNEKVLFFWSSPPIQNNWILYPSGHPVPQVKNPLHLICLLAYLNWVPFMEDDRGFIQRSQRSSKTLRNLSIFPNKFIFPIGKVVFIF